MGQDTEKNIGDEQLDDVSGGGRVEGGAPHLDGPRPVPHIRIDPAHPSGPTDPPYPPK